MENHKKGEEEEAEKRKKGDLPSFDRPKKGMGKSFFPFYLYVRRKGRGVGSVCMGL